MTEPFVTRVGVTGHRALPPTTQGLVRSAIVARLRPLAPVEGLTSLAEGADQLFARAVLDAKGTLFVVVPCSNYESTFGSDQERSSFRQLLSLASHHVVLPFDEPGEEAYWAAGREIVDLAERVFAVWDGKPAGGLGGTGDVVQYARERGTPIDIIWPSGASRI